MLRCMSAQAARILMKMALIGQIIRYDLVCYRAWQACFVAQIARLKIGYPI